MVRHICIGCIRQDCVLVNLSTCFFTSDSDFFFFFFTFPKTWVGRAMGNETTPQPVGKIRKIVYCIRIAFGLPYNCKPNLSLSDDLKAIRAKPFGKHDIFCVTVQIFVVAIRL